jgi:hypothetical protein
MLMPSEPMQMLAAGSRRRGRSRPDDPTANLGVSFGCGMKLRLNRGRLSTLIFLNHDAFEEMVRTAIIGKPLHQTEKFSIHQLRERFEKAAAKLTDCLIQCCVELLTKFINGAGNKPRVDDVAGRQPIDGSRTEHFTKLRLEGSVASLLVCFSRLLTEFQIGFASDVNQVLYFFAKSV